jgi:hypothetical protein
MKATLEFDLPEDASEHLRAVNAATAWVTLHEIDNRLRNIIKYGISLESSMEQELSEIRREINEVTALLGND